MLSSEDVPPVDRPNLSKDYLACSAPEDWLPLRTQFCYYSCGTPVEHRDGPRFTVGIYHVPGAAPPGEARSVAQGPAGD